MASRRAAPPGATIIATAPNGILRLRLVMSIVAISMTLQQASAAFHRPEGGPDGLYAAFVDEHGAPQVKYLGEGNTIVASNAVGHSRRAGGGRKLLDTGVHCQWNAVMNGNDVAYAVAGLANFFSSGTTWYFNFGQYYGGAVAFACNYGGSQYTTAGQVFSDENAISDACGANVGGWYSHESWKSSFGRTVNGWGFCKIMTMMVELV